MNLTKKGVNLTFSNNILFVMCETKRFFFIKPSSSWFGAAFFCWCKISKIRKIELKREYIATIFLFVKKNIANFQNKKNGKK